MPTASEILSTATLIANEWRWLAVAWHLLMGAAVVALVAGWRPSNRLAGVLVTPLGLESTFEIFGSVVAALALAVAFEAYRTRPATARLAVETA